jgi:hypothetical protein
VHYSSTFQSCKLISHFRLMIRLRIQFQAGSSLISKYNRNNNILILLTFNFLSFSSAYASAVLIHR